MRELMHVSYSPNYNTRVVYYGTLTDVLGMLRMLELWGSGGEFIGNQNFQLSDGRVLKSGTYTFELSQEFYVYAKSSDFVHKMGRKGIEVRIDD